MHRLVLLLRNMSLVWLAVSLLHPSFVPAQGFAVAFNGTNGKVAVSNSGAMNPSGAFTLEAWVWPERFGGTSDGRQILIHKWAGAGYPNQRSYYLQTQSDGSVEFALSTSGDLSAVYGLYSHQFLPLKEWSHVAGVYDGGLMKLFVNGIQDSAMLAVAGSGSAFAGTAPVLLGGAISDTVEPFSGYLDEVRISNVARYASNFSLQQNPFETDASTMLLLHLDEGHGISTANLGSTGGDAILNSGASWVTGVAVPEPAGLAWGSVVALAGVRHLRRRADRLVINRPLSV